MKPIFLLLMMAMTMGGHAQPHQRLSLDNGWLFHQGDIPFPTVTGHEMTYMNAKAGIAWGAAAPSYKDSNWRKLDLPHDWAVEGGFDSTQNISQGYRKRGIGWYRRHFQLDSNWKGQHLELQFDGIATHCTVWFNGLVVHRNWSGYSSMYIDITALANYGKQDNTIAIRVDANDQEGWWYEGAGIYRHTWLVKRSPLHIMTDGVYTHPVKTNNDWIIPGEITVENSGKRKEDFDVRLTLLDPSGKIIAEGKNTGSLMPLKKTITNIDLRVADPALWSIDDPVLYTAVTRLSVNGKLQDSLVTQPGFRTLRFSPDSGFFLNGKNIKIKGVCNHQDHAGVGTAVPSSLWEFRLRKLKEMGVNAHRCSHNPPSREFLDACDRLGILVMDENRNFNSSPEYMDQLEWMVRRDRNHPSIILWSVFNEEPMQGTHNGYEMVRRMNVVVKSLDTTRPVTAAMNGGLFEKENVSQAVDVVGFNYQIWAYDRFHHAFPAIPLTSSEDVSCLMVRGEYKTDTTLHIVDAYDTQNPPWGSTHRVGWKAIATRPFLAGCFIWTGFDYRGEPTPYDWPTISSNFGIMDICGFPKTAYYIHQAQWVTDRPVLHIVPHWNWPADSIGKKIKVMVMSNAEKIRLLLNGKLSGEQQVDKFEMNSFEVPYQPGKLEAIAYVKGKEVSRTRIETTDLSYQLQLVPDRTSMNGDGWDAMPVTVQVLDKKGRPVPTANMLVEFELEGPGKIIGLGNGDPNSHEPEKGNKRKLFNGFGQVILQTNAGAKEPVILKARSAGIIPASLSITVLPKESYPAVR